MLKSVKPYLIGCLLAIFAAHIVPAAGDSITIEGKTYKDVLVSKTSKLYYVTIPNQGKVVSVPVDEVDESTVSINDDPFYRDELKAQYRTTKENPQSAVANDPNFDVPIESARGSSEGESVNIYGNGGGGGGGSSLGVPRTVVQGVMAQSGMQFSGSGDVIRGTATNGAMKVDVELYGSDNDMTGIKVTMTVPQAQQAMLMQGFNQLQALAGQMPQGNWVGSWIQQNMGKLLQGETVENTQEGLYVQVAPFQTGGNVGVSITLKGA